jgi:membrane-bound metal-dependent hydrolase YbcI (DUF457 family)
MDPITHGIAGSLLGKGYFSERHGRVAFFAVALGSVFPDIDVVAEFFTDDPLSVIRYHRGFTHSLLGLPLFAVALAWLTVWALPSLDALFARRGRTRERWRGKDSPSWTVLALAYGVGILSHIVLDAMTSYGTRIWNPVSSERVAWDFLFIIDFTLTALVLLPQFMPWVYRDRREAVARAAGLYIVCGLLAAGIWLLTRSQGFPFSRSGLVLLEAALAAFFFLPAWRGRGFQVSRGEWCRGAVWATAIYLLACGVAHHAALQRVAGFASARGIQVVRQAAIPIPPSLLSWDGMILAPDGVYQGRFSLRDSRPAPFLYFPDSPPSPVMRQALALPEVGTYLWFARFPVIRTSREGALNDVDFLDLRFSMRRNPEKTPFTYRVVLDDEGDLVEADWVVGATGMNLRRLRPPRVPAEKK